MKLRIGIRTKVLLLIIGLLVAIFGIATLIFVQSTVRSLRQGLSNEAQSFAELATQPIGKTFLIYRDSGTVHIGLQVEQFVRLNPTISNVTIYDLDGTNVYSLKPAGPISPDIASSFNRRTIKTTDGKLTGVLQPFTEDTGAHRYGVLYSVSNSQIDKSIRDGVGTILMLAVFALLLVSLVLFVAMNQLFIKPVSKVSEAALAISAGDLDLEIEEERHDEIGDLAHSVNVMADFLKADITKLREVDQMKSEFMMISSHNLRTPLTVITGYLDLMKGMKLDGELRRVIEAVAANSSRLRTLAEDMLTVAQIEAGQQLAFNAEDVDINQMLGAIAEEFEVLAQKREVIFHYQAPRKAYFVKANLPYLRNALWNLLDNALKFTKSGGTVALTVTAPRQLEISVNDTGIGIDEAELPKLFTKFHRGTSTLQYDYEGAGIGLYLTRLIMRQMNGDVRVSSKLGKGSTFTLVLPLWPDKTPKSPGLKPPA